MCCDFFVCSVIEEWDKMHYDETVGCWSWLVQCFVLNLVLLFVLCSALKDCVLYQ